MTALARPVPEWSMRLGPRSDGLRALDRSAAIDGALGVRLPEDVREPITFAPHGLAEASTRWTLEGARSTPLGLDQGRALYRDALPETDVVWVADDGRAELFAVLKSPQAPATLTWTVALGAGLARAEKGADGAIAFVDASGRTRLRVAGAEAIDAAGTRRMGSLSWADGRLSLAVNTDGLTFPVLIDPVVETAFWDVAMRPEAPPPSWGDVMAYDPVRQRAVLLMAYGSRSATWEWDGTRWFERSPVHAPPPLRHAAMAWDPVGRRTIVFGGSGVDRVERGETWAWDGNDWTIVAATGPSARQRSSMTTDTVRGRVVLFGGKVEGAVLPSYFGDTWEWDGAEWILMATVGPSRRAGAAFAYDPTRGRAVLMGGEVSGVFNETWEWDGRAWGLLNPDHRPPSVGTSNIFTTAAYDAAHQRVVFIEGVIYPDLCETWTWDGRDWTRATVGKIARYSTPLTYDEARGELLTFGGVRQYYDPATSQDVNYGAELWAYNGARWVIRTPAPTMPRARRKHVAVYDEARAQTIVFGGDPGVPTLGDTWAWDGRQWSLPAVAVSPRPRNGAAISYDSLRTVSWLFGGFKDLLTSTSNSATALGDFWAWDGVTWTPVTASPLPPARGGHAMSFDRARGRLVLFGGRSANTTFNDTWEWDGRAWEQHASAATPRTRSGAGMAYDEARGRVVLFGGVDGTAVLGDTWVWDGIEWLQRSPPLSPPPDRDVSMSYDPHRQRIVLFGSASTGTWEWDGTTWLQRETLGAPLPLSGASTAFDRARNNTVLFGGSSSDLTWEGTTWTYSVVSPCSAAADCVSGFCVDGVCCDSACGGGATNDCMACSLAAGGARDGRCTALVEPSVVTCRPTAGACDLAESCVAGSMACPSDEVMDSSTSCRAVAGACDLPESCDGASPECPVDLFSILGTECRASEGPCDVSEACTGNSAACPSDEVASDAVVCRTSAGPCDVAERCDGTSKGCAVDILLSTGVTCRASEGPCDVSEACTGNSAACPSDEVASDAVVCRASAGACDVHEACDGVRKACPADALVASGVTCRVAEGPCDVAEACTGNDAACPSDAVASDAVVCRMSAGPCDVAERCDGTSKGCAVDILLSTGVTCRASEGPCDLAEACTGNSVACPSDAVASDAVVCRASAGPCDVPEACDGARVDCPTDAFVAAGVTCRASSGPCDVAETCRGESAACPSDAVAGDSVVCRARAGACDVPEACDGVRKACPVDGFVAAGVVCRASEGPCDVAESCAGHSAACPSDAVAGEAVVCRESAGPCDVHEVCDAVHKACPADGRRDSATVCRAASCESGVSIFEARCAGEVTCPEVVTVTCGDFVCGADACRSACERDADCVAGFFCGAGGQCEPRRPDGGRCDGARECGSGRCVDGVCCASACAGQCEACDVPGHEGECVAVAGAPHGERTGCAGTGVCAGACDGLARDRCAYPTSTCREASCADARAVLAASCDGAGHCPDAVTQACTPFRCGGTACAGDCADDAACAGENWCSGGVCVPKKSIGEACGAAGECANGTCVDGVCCERACEGQCEACDADGRWGRCVPVEGRPHGSRAACAGQGKCAGTCDGVRVDGCRMPGAETVCEAARCDEGQAIAVASCDGAGACGAAEVRVCGAYACVEGACRTSCASATDCANGAACLADGTCGTALIPDPPEKGGCACGAADGALASCVVFAQALLRRRRIASTQRPSSSSGA